MYYVDYCSISELGRVLAAVSRNHDKIVSITQYYRKGEVTFALIITDEPEKE